jgi:hypothetical protein
MNSLNNRLYKFPSLLLTLTLFACATQSGTWVKSDVAPLQFNQDNYACLQESQQPYGYSQGSLGWGMVGALAGVDITVTQGYKPIKSFTQLA